MSPHVRVAALIAVGMTVCGCAAWPQFRGGADRNARQDGEHKLGVGASVRLVPRWSTATGGAVESSPAVSGDGTLYVGSRDHSLHAFDAASGAPRWATDLGGDVDSSPAWSSGVVYAGSADGSLRALDAATGTERWRAVTAGAVESSPVVSGTTVFVGSDDGTVRAFATATGAPIWTASTGGPVRSSPAVSGSTVFVGSDDGTVRAFATATGAPIGTAPTGGPVRSTSAIRGASIYVGSDDGKLRALDTASGAVRWTVTTGGKVDGSPAVDASGTVYVAGEDGVLRALESGTGHARWTVSLDAAAVSSPTVADGVLYVGTRDGRLLAYATANGTLQYSDTTGGPIVSSPAEANQTVYVGSDDGKIRAYAPAGPCSPPTNPIVCENSKPGTPRADWDVSGGGDPSIQGFATDISVDVGDTVHFKIDTPATAYHLDIYRLGYYGGLGARHVDTVAPSAPLPQVQPACPTDPVTELVDCGTWNESAAWNVPADAVSGIYVAKLVRDDVSGAASHIVFVVRDDASHSDLLFQTSDTTWVAYNDYGGAGIYIPGPQLHQTYKASYNRPLDNRGVSGHDPNQVFGDSEYPMVRFLEANGYDVSYASGVDTDRFGAHLLQHRVFMSVGHDEYWTKAQRDNVEGARDAGVDLAFFSGNESYWKMRWEPSIDPSQTVDRTLVVYKESTTKLDPSPSWTGLWRDQRFSPPADAGRPENAMSGTIFATSPVDCCDSFPLTVSQEEGALRLWRDTSLATLAAGSSATFGDRVVGYEFDEDLDNGFRPAGLVELSSSVRPSNQRVHHVTFYRAASGALVFGFGTNQWAFGLDDQGGATGSTPDVRIRQATVNVLADMGVQPLTLADGLAPERPSADTIAPSSTITRPSDGSSFQAGSVVTVSGSASDAGGGHVGAVEVSVDGGSTWHPAKGRSSWTYSFSPTVATGPLAILSRAADDSGNIQGVPARRSVTITPRPCPCSIFGTTAPTRDDSGSAAPIEVGMKFRADTPGAVTAIRFYKSAANTGPHVGSLWTTDGTLLAQVPFTSETGSGWQEVPLAQPVPLVAGQLYVVSYHSDSGHTADVQWFTTHWSAAFSDVTGVDATPLHMVSGRGPDAPNGVYTTGPSAFPTTASQADNYFVDVEFSPS
jgi:outer membrane protein assembly factor BamB